MVHLKMLQTILAHLTGDKTAKPRYGAHWTAIGFQGNDPATDLRDLGMFSIVQMLFLVTKQLRKGKKMFRFASEHEEEMGAAGHGYPFMLLGISLSKVCLQVLRSGSLTSSINSAASVIEVLNKLYLGMLCDFHATWRSKHLSVERGDFQKAFEQTADRAARSPASIIKVGQSDLWKPPHEAAGAGPSEFVDF
eukprot:Tamp_18305.p1 GENE.Tamp_18305~~Tamp_18305.p1  ORF type:complete len:193 (-),score=33.62 Tamp_18305:317-895(-)